MYNKENIYDEQICPLMTQIIDICKNNGINMIASYYLIEETENNDDLYCTTFIPGEKQCQKLDNAYNVLFNNYEVNKPFFMSLVITKEK